MICFDMDGTIADLYGVDNWLPRLRAEDASPYEDATPMWDMTEISKVLHMLKAEGWEIRVITWLSKDSTEAYKTKVRQAKRSWLQKWEFPYDHFHGVAYGTTKADSIRKTADYAVLIDDNAQVRKGWSKGTAIDPTACDLIHFLKCLLTTETVCGTI